MVARSECASVPSLDHPPLLARLHWPIGCAMRGFTERRETVEAHGFPGCSHSHTQPLAAGHISVIGHQRHRIYLFFSSSLV